jgi:hypothetical protein
MRASKSDAADRCGMPLDQWGNRHGVATGVNHAGGPQPNTDYATVWSENNVVTTPSNPHGATPWL